MVEKNKTNDKNYKNTSMGKEMVALIDLVAKQFEEKYGLKPNNVEISNLIARRVIEHNLF